MCSVTPPPGGPRAGTRNGAARAAPRARWRPGSSRSHRWRRPGDGCPDGAAGFVTHDHYQAHPKFGDGELQAAERGVIEYVAGGADDEEPAGYLAEDGLRRRVRLRTSQDGGGDERRSPQAVCGESRAEKPVRAACRVTGGAVDQPAQCFLCRGVHDPSLDRVALIQVYAVHVGRRHESCATRLVGGAPKAGRLRIMCSTFADQEPAELTRELVHHVPPKPGI